MDNAAEAIDGIASEIGFSGVVRVDRTDEPQFARAYGLARRANAIANTVDTRFGIASGTKGFTALTVMSLIEDGTLSFEATARSVLGQDLPLIDDAVTVEALLTHCSGIGDYYDEEIDRPITDYTWRCRSRSSRRSRASCASLTASRQSSRPASGSRTATAATSCWH